MAHYAPLPNPGLNADAGRELDDAFESDDEDDANLDHETAPLNRPPQSTAEPRSFVETSSIPGGYDFEREYDFPPPGSPPRPTSRALPNDYGNSNGYLPISPINVSVPGPSFFRRAVGAILPMHYVGVPADPQVPKTRGGGIENDGVFANVMAKPQKAQVVRTDDGEVHIVPEEGQKETPPSYADAQADAVPPYWETTVHAPASLDPNADMIVDDLPTGSILIFGLNLFTSFFFQFVGFLLTYLLHTSHAAKYGSRAGLGLTLIQFGFYSRSVSFSTDTTGENAATDGTSSAPAVGGNTASTGTDSTMPVITSKDWLAFLFMTLGWFILLSSVIGFWRVKRWEKSIRSVSTPVSPEDIERDIAIRRNLEQVFGISFREDEEERRQRTRIDEDGNVIVIPAPGMLEEARLTRDLRAAGLL